MAMPINSPAQTSGNAPEPHVAHGLGGERCPRCAGLMVSEWCADLLDDTGQFDFAAWRCVQCGEVLDPVILQNRLRHHPVGCNTGRQASHPQW